MHRQPFFAYRSVLGLALFCGLFMVNGCCLLKRPFAEPPDSDLEHNFAIVSVPVANLGDEPLHASDSHVVTQARLGDYLRIIDESLTWCLVEMEDGYRGWIAPENVIVATEAGVNKLRKGWQAVVTAKTTRAFSEPGGLGVFDHELVQGSVLPLKGRKIGFSELLAPDGCSIWVDSQNISSYQCYQDVFATKRGVQAVIETARQYLGLPYLWGGCTAYGFDCSGFTQFCMKMNGYLIKRDADMQYEQGFEVEDRRDLIAGDLVFFETYQKGPSHVGIYIDEGRYIHCGGSGVAINSFNISAPEYSEGLDRVYLGARRVIK